MTKFIALIFSYLPNEAHYRFFEQATIAVGKTGAAVKNVLGSLITTLNTLFVEETACIEWYVKSAFTELIAAANHRLDHALTGMKAQVNAARYNANPNVAAAAERLHIMLKSYGDVASKPYLQEAGAVRAILVHLSSDCAVDAQTVGLSVWISELTAALTEFSTLIGQREAQTLQKPKKPFPAVRREIEDVWHQIVVLVDAGAALNTSPDFATLINSLNPEIELLNREFHHVRYNIADSQPAPFETQYYTGQPLTPLPASVLFVTPEETLKLELGKDYNVSYRNNTEVGNADCIVHGKGSYKGHKTVTFAIIRKS
jgi:hypothetical protein